MLNLKMTCTPILEIETLNLFRAGDFNGDNEFGVKVTRRAYIDLHMTFRLAVDIDDCYTVHGGFSTRGTLWLCRISCQGQVEGIY